MSYDREPAWQEQANCKGKAFELFEYQEKDSPLAKGMSYRERLEFNDANFELAAEICIECPVFLQCGENATEEDRQWTVRAGEAPLRFADEKEGLGSPAARVCQAGHFLPDGGRCKMCKKEANRKRLANLKA
jgi:hypothetical protein